MIMGAVLASLIITFFVILSQVLRGEDVIESPPIKEDFLMVNLELSPPS